MLITGSQIIGTPVMSLQTGEELARAHKAVIDPGKLTVVAYLVVGPHLDHNPSYLRIADIREIGRLGMIIDSSDEFVEPDDIVINKSTYDEEYELVGKPVYDTRNKKIGKVEEYVVDIDSFVIEQILVRLPLFKSFTDDELLVRRSQIEKLTDEKVIIKSGHEKDAKKAKHGKGYVNPFRNTTPQPETIKLDDGR